MRSLSLPKSLLLAVLGCAVLAGCGARSATTDQALAAATAPDASVSAEDQELRFMELLTRDVPRCNQYIAKDKGGLPEDLPGWEPGAPSAGGSTPVPLPDAPPPPEPDPDVTPPNREEEVPLNAYEECFGVDEAQRVGEAFKNTKAADYQAMQKKLTELGYPAPRIHRMPDHAGAPRARVDLRMMGGRLALEVTGTGHGVTVEAFGASEEEGVNLVEVKRKPKP
ncbi:hypothetical protein M8Z33_18175 [Streptomyces sp. ZAF1911]|uniref:hypothetical protein n=1 Tax=Streptomyces sp. ZAF1911 TaxID=2944129 RepID=UPI00237C4C78|nr:hypothetical protein [Streptomyces sp. ZAF1911]MDD9378549.1 hypothetical protein [Streptomyces sp. ZAF1911]